MTETIGVEEISAEVDLDGSEPVGSLSEEGSRYSLPPRSGIACALLTLSALAILCIRNHSLFSVPIREQGDEAANSILVNQAVHFQLLVGNYSREGFNHPGPAFLYLLSFGQDVFYSWLHVVPAQFNGQLIALFMVNCLMLGLATLVIARHSRSWSTALLAMSIVVLLTGTTVSWTSAWMPYVYVAPFLLATLAGVSVGLGALQDLPIFTLAVALLVHGHIAFVGIMGIYVVLVVTTWCLLHRPRFKYMAQLRAAKRSFLISGIIAFLFAVPIATELIFHWPGQLGLYWHYLRSNSQQHHHSVSAIFSYLESFWPGGHVGLALLLLAAAAAIALAITDGNRIRSRFVLGLLISVVVMTVEVAIYAFKGVDYLNLQYTGYFYYPIALVIAAALVVEGIGRLGAMAAEPTLHHRKRRVRAVPVIFCTVLAIATLATRASAVNTYWGEPAMPRIAAAIHESPLRDGRGVAFAMGDVGAPTADWPDVVGLLVAASREGYQPCIANPAWRFVVTSEYICSPTEGKERWKVAVELTSTPVPPGASLVFRNASVEVYASPALVAMP